MRKILLATAFCFLGFAAVAQTNSNPPSSGAATAPGGASTNVQFNNSGAFGGISTFTTDGSGNVGMARLDFNAGTHVIPDGNSGMGVYNGGFSAGFILTGVGAVATPNMHLGSVDAAAPIAQMMGVQGVVAGTSNGAAPAWAIIGSLPTGNGGGGDIVVQTTGSGAGATAQNTPVTALTIKGATQNVVFASGRIAGGTVPVGTTGSCVASSFVGGAMAGKFAAAVCAGGTIILSSLPVAPNGYTCNAQDQTTPTTGVLQQTANTVSSATFKATTTAADVVVFQCTGW